ncbi:cytoskeletal protein RodZ [Rhodococcus sp. 27YEA15]|uniref:Rv1733c family protein n=1 Tax=Rhodococcus sp. 27YEA15 TaxID=3156259 RepID=UPI003C7D1E83
MSGGTRGTASLLRRSIALGHDPMVRRTDRIEGLLSFALIICAIVLVPFAVWAGSATAANQRALMAEQALHVHSVVATTTANSTTAQTSTADYIPPISELAKAEWIWNGQVRTGEISVTASTPANTQIDIYVDDNGAKTSAPITKSAADAAAVITGVFTWFSVMSLLALGFMLVRAWLDRTRTAQWDRELRAFLDAHAP